MRTDADLDDLTRLYAGARLESGLHVCFAREGLAIAF
jgi:hypothetical protein